MKPARVTAVPTDADGNLVDTVVRVPYMSTITLIADYHRGDDIYESRLDGKWTFAYTPERPQIAGDSMLSAAMSISPPSAPEQPGSGRTVRSVRPANPPEEFAAFQGARTELPPAAAPRLAASQPAGEQADPLRLPGEFAV